MAILKAFPQMANLPEAAAIVTRCGNVTHGDFQCNNSLSIAKLLKTLSQDGGKS